MKAKGCHCHNMIGSFKTIGVNIEKISMSIRLRNLMNFLWTCKSEQKSSIYQSKMRIPRNTKRWENSSNSINYWFVPLVSFSVSSFLSTLVMIWKMVKHALQHMEIMFQFRDDIAQRPTNSSIIVGFAHIWLNLNRQHSTCIRIYQRDLTSWYCSLLQPTFWLWSKISL